MKSRSNKNTILDGTLPRIKKPQSRSGNSNHHDLDPSKGLLLRDCSVVLTDVLNNAKQSIPHKTSNVISCMKSKGNGTKCCGSKRCKTCPLINTSDSFTSSYTNKTFKVSQGDLLTCKSSNVIYLITCKKCGFQYVGETKCTLQNRFNGHRGSILGKKKKHTYLAEHFRQRGHAYNDLSVQIIEKLDTTGNDKEDKALRLQREKFWMTELCTIFPFGLNDKVHGIGNVSQTTNDIHASMLFNKHKRKPRSHGHRKNNKRSLHQTTAESIDELVKNDRYCLHQVKCALYSLPLSLLHKINEEALQKYFSGNILDISYYLISEISYNRLFKPVMLSSSQPPRYFLKLDFDNKGIDAINISNILHNKSVRKHIPPYFQNVEVPIVSYKYTRTIRNDIVNYNEVLKDLELGNDVLVPTTCDCQTSQYCYAPHGHVITGNLNIIANDNLRKLIKKGPKFREQNVINWAKNKKIILEAVEKYAKQWCKREGAEPCALDDWIDSIKQIITSKIKLLARRTVQQPQKVLQSEEVQSYLQQFKEKYVLVPADKASNNIIVICKYFYIQTIKVELGITSANNNDTYSLVDSSIQDIVSSHIKYFAVHNIPLPSTCQDLPRLYWIPKIHKNPYKARYIAGSRTCTTKPLSGLLTKAFQLIKEQQVKYCNSIYRTTGINRMWIIKNSTSLLTTLEEGNMKKVSNISTWDFSTLYTTIPHEKLKDRICRLIKFSFKKYNYINIGNYRTFFSEDVYDKPNYLSWSCKEFCELFSFLIDNIYIKFGNNAYRQVIGIPMGTDCAPLLADLFLYTYEYDFLDTLTKSNQLHLAKRFNFSMRYIDDLLSLDNKHFAKFVDEIYPDELELKETTESQTSASYLDLMLSTTDNILQFKLYDKRDDFDFPIVNYPYIDSNIPVKPAYGVYVSQLIRYSRACSFYCDFVYRHKFLVDKLVSQGYKRHILKQSFKKFFHGHQDLLQKYNTQLSVHINDAIFAKSCNSTVTEVPLSTSTAHIQKSSPQHCSPPPSPPPVQMTSPEYMPTGLPNLGNTCYLNAVLQCILNCHHQCNILNGDNSRRIDLVSALVDVNHPCVADIHKILSSHDAFFNTTAQQDAHEALLKLLNIIHTTMSYNPLGNIVFSQPNSQLLTSVVKENFYGSFHVAFTCSICQANTHSTEEFVDLVIDSYGDVKSGFKSLLRDEIDKFCSNCNTNTKHQVSRTIWQQPNICIFIINRFKQLNTGRVHKNSSTVYCDYMLNLPHFKAQLMAAIFHKGATKDSGHYISVIRSADKWYECNDHNIKRIEFKDFCSSKEVYIMFYQKLN